MDFSIEEILNQVQIKEDEWKYDPYIYNNKSAEILQKKEVLKCHCLFWPNMLFIFFSFFKFNCPVICGILSKIK